MSNNLESYKPFGEGKASDVYQSNLPHKAKMDKILSTVRIVLVTLILGGCTSRYHGCIDWDSYDESSKKAPETKKQLNPDKYLGTWKGKKGKNEFTVTFDKLGAKNKTGPKQSLKLNNGETANLILPIEVDGEYNLTITILRVKEKEINGSISSIGGVYESGNKILIIFWEPQLQQDIVMVIREKDGKMEASLPGKYNGDKVSNQFHGWFELKK